ncbi:MAG: hypothetical protein ABSE91_01125 [Patescibacteria group bacterium]
MSTWQIIKSIVRDLSFDRKKFLLFLVIFVVGIGVYLIWKNQTRPKAAVLYDSSTTEFSDQINTDIVIAKDGKVTIDGKKENNAINYYQNYDEFDLIAFNNPSQYVSAYQATVHLPSAVDAQNIRQIIYAVHGVGDTLAYTTDPQTLVYQVSDISPGSTVTIVARLPKGLIQVPFWKKWELAVELVAVKSWIYLAVTLPVVTFLILAFIYWRRRAKQNIFSKALLSKLPDRVPPALAGVVIDGAVGPREIAGTLIDLAERGYIFIINDGKGEFNFGKRRFTDLDTTQGLSNFEKALLSKIFLPKNYKSTVDDVEMRIGRHIFSRKIADFYVGLYDLATEKGYFVKNPSRVHLAYRNVGIGLFFLSFLGFLYGAIGGLDPKYALIFWLGGMAAAALIIRTSPYMPALTGAGIEKAREWMAFRQYLSLRESAPASDVLGGKLNEYLPYAIVLGSEVDWIKRFKKEPFSVPDWYEMPNRATTIEDFANGLFPIIGYVSRHLAHSHDPITE